MASRCFYHGCISRRYKRVGIVLGAIQCAFPSTAPVLCGRFTTTQPVPPLPLEIRQTQQAVHCDHTALNSTHLCWLTQTRCESRQHRAETPLGGAGEEKKKMTVLRILFFFSLSPSLTFLHLTFLSHSCLPGLSLLFCWQQA